jgi:hypothetical protein
VEIRGALERNGFERIAVEPTRPTAAACAATRERVKKSFST